MSETRLMEIRNNMDAIPINLFRQVMKQLFEAIEFIHEKSIVHRDLKVSDVNARLNFMLVTVLIAVVLHQVPHCLFLQTY